MHFLYFEITVISQLSYICNFKVMTSTITLDLIYYLVDIIKKVVSFHISIIIYFFPNAFQF